MEHISMAYTEEIVLHEDVTERIAGYETSPEFVLSEPVTLSFLIIKKGK